MAMIRQPANFPETVKVLRRKLLTGMKSRTSSRICPASGFTRVRLAGAGQ